MTTPQYSIRARRHHDTGAACGADLHRELRPVRVVHPGRLRGTGRGVRRHEQIEEFGLVENPAPKKSRQDPRAEPLAARYGDVRQVEVEAIDPPLLRQLYTDALQNNASPTFLANYAAYSARLGVFREALRF